MDTNNRRRKAFTSVVLAGTLVLGSMALAIAASTTSAGAAGPCAGSQVPNTVTLGGTGYEVAASSGVTFTPSSLLPSSTKVKWSLNSGHEHKGLSSLYVSSSGSSSDSSSTSSTREVVKKKSGRTLFTVTVCTLPIAPPAPPAPLTCPGGQVPNVVTRINGVYTVGASPQVTFNQGSLTNGSSISWSVNDGFDQKTVAAKYSSGSSTTSSSGSSSATSISKTKSGLPLVALTVCTIPTPPPTVPPPPPAPSEGGCGAGNVQNVAVRVGSNYVDQTSPGLAFKTLTGLSGSIGRTLVGTTQVDGGVAVYDGGIVRSVDDDDLTVPKKVGSRQLIVAKICTTAP
jgi:hypothetical protein